MEPGVLQEESESVTKAIQIFFESNLSSGSAQSPSPTLEAAQTAEQQNCANALAKDAF